LGLKVQIFHGEAKLGTTEVHKISPLFKTVEETGIDVIAEGEGGGRIFSIHRNYLGLFLKWSSIQFVRQG